MTWSMGRETEARGAESEKSHDEIPGEETKTNEADTAVTGFLNTDPGSVVLLKEDTEKMKLHFAPLRETSDGEK